MSYFDDSNVLVVEHNTVVEPVNPSIRGLTIRVYFLFVVILILCLFTLLSVVNSNLLVEKVVRDVNYNFTRYFENICLYNDDSNLYITRGGVFVE